MKNFFRLGNGDKQPSSGRSLGLVTLSLLAALAVGSSQETTAQPSASGKSYVSLEAGGTGMRADYRMGGSHYGAKYTYVSEKKDSQTVSGKVGFNHLKVIHDRYGRQEESLRLDVSGQVAWHLRGTGLCVMTQAGVSFPVFVDHELPPEQVDDLHIVPFAGAGMVKLFQTALGRRIAVYGIINATMGDKDHNKGGDKYPWGGAVELGVSYPLTK